MKFAAGLLALAAADTKIIGGFTPTPNSEPYILSLQKSGSHFCGATIVSSTRSVCAAHCYQRSGVTAVAGAHDIKKNESSQQKKSVSSFINHESYNSNTLQNDIAVLKHSAFSLNSKVAALPLPGYKSGEWMKSGETVRVCGWGNTKYPGSSYPSTLKCVDVKYITVSDCNARNKYNGAILKGMFCAGVSGGGKDACQGDSGGPVKKSNQLVGAVSWGYGCAQASYPGVYSDVAQFRRWIDGKM